MLREVLQSTIWWSNTIWNSRWIVFWISQGIILSYLLSDCVAHLWGTRQWEGATTTATLGRVNILLIRAHSDRSRTAKYGYNNTERHTRGWQTCGVRKFTPVRFRGNSPAEGSAKTWVLAGKKSFPKRRYLRGSGQEMDPEGSECRDKRRKLARQRNNSRENGREDEICRCPVIPEEEEEEALPRAKVSRGRRRRSGRKRHGGNDKPFAVLINHFQFGRSAAIHYRIFISSALAAVI